MLTRVEGERIRVKHYLDQLEATVASLRMTLSHERWPAGFAQPQSLLETAGLVAMTLARLDAYQRAEEDAK